MGTVKQFKENNDHQKPLGDIVLLHFIKTCRSYADVLNMAYISSKCGFKYNYVVDLIARKKAMRDREKMLLVIGAILEYCDEVSELREKIKAIQDEITA